MPLENEDGPTQLTGSTFSGEPSVVGGVYYGSGTVGSLPAYVQSFQVDPSGSLYVTASGSLPVHIDAPIQATIAGQIGVDNFPAYQAVSGSVNTYTSGLQGVSGTVQVWSEAALPVSGAVALTNWPATLGVSSSSPLQVYSSGTLGVSGSVAVTNWPAVHGVSSSSPSGFWSTGGEQVSGSVNVYTSGPQAVSGTVQVWTEGAFPVSGTVTAEIGNWPATIGVSSSAPLQVYSSGTLGVSGSVALTNWPAIHGVSSSSPSGFWSSGIAGVSGSVNTYTSGLQGVSGTVQVWTEGAFPVSGTVTAEIGNWPATIGVSSSAPLQVYSSGTLGVSGSVALTNWPAIHGVSSSSPSGFWFGGTAGVSGSVAITNWPAVSGLSSSSPSGFWSTGPMAVTGSQLTGSTFVGFPVVVAGCDGVYVRTLLTDNAGALYVTTSPSGSFSTQVNGLVPSGSTQAGNPVTVSGVDPTGIVRSLDVDSFGRLVIAPAGTNTTNGFVVGTISTAAKTNVAIRASTYNEQTSNAQRSVSSNNAADVDTTGTGAQEVTITYYDQNYNGPFTETVLLNGTTAVNTVSTTMCFIEKMVISEVGTGGSNVGVITLFTTTGGGGSTLGQINAGDNRTFWAHHYTPTGKSTFITDFTGNNDNGSNYTLFTIRAKASGSMAPDLQVSDYLVEGGGVAQTQRSYGTPIVIAGPARVVVWGAPNTTATTISRVSFDFYDQ